MDELGGQTRPLAVPGVERKHFPRNFISQAVCELRFPTLFELDSERPPLKLASALRKEFPTHERLTNVKVGADGVGRTSAHAFRSRKNHWAVTLKVASISLETAHYDSFEEFVDKLAFVVKSAAEVIDTDFFTRIGLRYVNGIPCSVSDVAEWVNPDLVRPLAGGIFGEPSEYSQRVYGTTDYGGGYLFQHGLGKNDKTGATQYVLDYDFFVEDTSIEESLAQTQKLHDAEHSLFRWSLGPRSKEWLGAGKT